MGYADKIIFNSLGQLDRFGDRAAGIARGLRLNPRFSTSGFDLADPARPFSRLGEWDLDRLERALDRISGVMIHYNCENGDFDLFDRPAGPDRGRVRRASWNGWTGSAWAAASISPARAIRWTRWPPG